MTTYRMVLYFLVTAVACLKEGRLHAQFLLSEIGSMRAVQVKSFPPHPGIIVFHDAWNGGRRQADSEAVPDAIKFVYFDESGREASDYRLATSRVPVVEIWTVSVDRMGRPAEPRNAVTLSITQYGPEHRFLRHTTASGGAAAK